MTRTREVNEEAPSATPEESQSASSTLPGVDRRFTLTTFSAFRVKPFRWLFTSAMTGTIGYEMQVVALGWLIYVLTGSAFYLGAVTTMQSITQTGISPIGGVFADRFDRRKYIMLVRIITLPVSLGLALLIATHRISIVDLIIAAAIFGVAFGLNGPARQALVAQLVGKDLLMNAVSLMSGGSNLMRIMGPALAGVLIGVIGVDGIYVILAICYLMVILAMVPIPSQPPAIKASSRNMIGDLTDGFTYCFQNPTVLALLLVGTVPLFFSMPYIPLLPIFAERIWNVGVSGYGVLSAAPGVGGLIGALSVASFSHYQRKGVLIIGGVALYGILLVAFAGAFDFPMALLCLALAGAMGVIYTATVSSVIQSIIPNEMRGRVMSLYQMSFGISGLSALPASAIAGWVGAPATIFGCGLLTVASGLFIFWMRPSLASL